MNASECACIPVGWRVGNGNTQRTLGLHLLVTTTMVCMRCAPCGTLRDTIANPLALLCMAFVGVANFFGMNIILAVGKGAVSPVRRLPGTLIMFSLATSVCVCVLPRRR